MADHTAPATTTRPARPARPSRPVEDGSVRTERRVNIRVFIYVIGLHVFAGFAMLLYYFGQHQI